MSEPTLRWGTILNTVSGARCDGGFFVVGHRVLSDDSLSITVVDERDGASLQRKMARPFMPSVLHAFRLEVEHEVERLVRRLRGCTVHEDCLECRNLARDCFVERAARILQTTPDKVGRVKP